MPARRAGRNRPPLLTQLIGFFVNPPLAMLSGTLTPIEAMPRWRFRSQHG
jgi:hypothetical protein